MASPIETRTLPVNVDVCEFNRDHQGLLAVGCYELDEASNLRKGLLALYDCNEEGTLKEIHTLDVPGIFDAKWMGTTLAVASCTGDVDMYTWNNADRMLSLRTSAPIKACVDDDENPVDQDMALSVCWVSQTTFLATYSSGKIALWRIDEHGEPVAFWVRPKAHDFEAWSATYAPEDGENVIISGGDDGKLQCWDIRAGKSPVLKSTHYRCGVTSFEHSKSREESSPYLYIGSYDDTISIWDMRKFKSPVKCENVGGGVWRIRCKTINGRDRLACATMYDGFTVIDGMTSDDVNFANKTKYHGPHKTLAYGIDWRSNSDDEDLVLACGSFYDKILSIVAL